MDTVWLSIASFQRSHLVIKMSYGSSQKVQKVMVQPINLIFRYLQNRTRVSVWLYENVNTRCRKFKPPGKILVLGSRVTSPGLTSTWTWCWTTPPRCTPSGTRRSSWAGSCWRATTLLWSKPKMPRLIRSMSFQECNCTTRLYVCVLVLQVFVCMDHKMKKSC